MISGTEHDTSSEETELGEDSGESLFSPAELAVFCVRAIRQNLVLCLCVASFVCLVGGTLVAALPPIYDSTFKIFIRDTATGPVVTGHRSRALDGAHGLREIIFAHDNLLNVVREAHIVERWPDTRIWPMRLKDRAMESMFGPPPREGAERGFVAMLEKSISAELEGDSVRVHVQWREAETAFDMAHVVQKNFLAARADYDMGPFQRAIPFLEGQLKQADEALEVAVTRVEAVKDKAGIETPVSEELEAAEAAEEGGRSSGEARMLSRQLSDVRQRQRAINDTWRRRSTDLKARLVEAKARLSSEHPEVLSLEAQVHAASEVPEDLAALREEESALLATIGAQGHGGGGGGGRHGTLTGAERAAAVAANVLPELDAARARLSSALRHSNEVAERLEEARIQLATAEEDFSHRYAVIEEPMISSAPLKRKKPLLFALVGVASLVLGALAAVGWQIRRGRLDEPWQVRALGPPLLAEVDLRRLPPPKKS